MNDNNNPLSALRDDVFAHVSTEALVDYCDGALGKAEAAEVADHIDMCAQCAKLARNYREGLASSTGFDPITGDRLQLDAEWDVSKIPALTSLPAADFALQAAAPTVAGGGEQDFDKSGLRVKLSLINNQLRAIVRRGLQPVAEAEVRLELRGERHDSKDFDLYAWATTDADGAADLGSFRRFPSFPNGHRFVLGIVLPKPRD